MKRILIIFILALSCFSASSQIKLFGNSGYNSQSFKFYWLNGSDSLARIATWGTQFFKPVYLSSLSTGGSVDSVIVVSNGLVKKVAQSSIGSTLAITSTRIPFGNPSNAQATSAELRYLDSISTLLSLGLISRSYSQVGDSSVNLQSSKTSIFFGNSLFAGTTISPTYLRASTQIANLTNTREENRAIGGTRMKSLTGTDSSMQNRTYIIPTYSAGTHAYLFFEYGTNDILSTSVDTADYRIAYNGVIDDATSKGWPTSKIVVVGPGLLVDANPTIQARVPQIASITKDLAGKKGVVYADTYKAMSARGGTALLTTDNVHHTERGVEVWVDAITSAIGGTGGTHRVNGYLTAGMLNLYQMKNPGNASVFTAYDTTYKPFIELRGKFQATGGNSFSIGLDAQPAITTAQRSYSIGGIAGASLQDANDVINIGYNAGNANVSGSNVINIGTNAGRVLTVPEIVNIGRDAGYSQTTATGIVNVGYYAGRSNISGSNSTNTGWYAGNGFTGAGNTNFGANAGRNGGTGANNTNGGYNAGFSTGAGSNNANWGYRAGRGNTGSNNTNVGAFAGDSLGNATAVTHIGYRAGYRSKNVTGNTFIGFLAGQNNFSGSNNLGIGGYEGKDTALNKQVWLSTGDQIVPYYADVPNSFSGAFTVNPQYAWDINGKLGIRTVTNGAATDSALVINNNEVKKIAPAYSLEYTDTTGVTVANTTTETSILGSGIGTIGFPTLPAGSIVKVSGTGEISTDATAGIPTFEMRVGSFTLGTALTGLANSLSNSLYEYEVEVTPTVFGSNKPATYSLRVTVDNNGSPKKYWYVTKITNWNQQGIVEVNVQWNTAATNNSFRSYTNKIEVFRK